MKKILFSILTCIFCLISSGCDSDDWKDDIDFTTEWCIASEKHTVNISMNPGGTNYQLCYIIKSLNPNKQKVWYYSFDEIIGFKYEEGYEYKIRVAIMKTDIMDSSAPIRLLKVLSKEKKQSEGLPDPTTWTGFLH